MTSRFVIGIDLGTTNCALALRDTSRSEEQLRTDVLPIPQLSGPGTVEAAVPRSSRRGRPGAT